MKINARLGSLQRVWVDLVDLMDTYYEDAMEIECTERRKKANGLPD